MKLLYFAWVRQKVGKNEEILALPADISTVHDLANYLCALGPGYAEAFSDPKRLRAAANQGYVALKTCWNSLPAADTILLKALRDRHLIPIAREVDTARKPVPEGSLL